jgi:hypothetical protein
MSFVEDGDDGLHAGHDDPLSLAAFVAILDELPAPSRRGSAWAEWETPGGEARVVLQASYIERVSDGLRVAHPRIWYVPDAGPLVCRELAMRDAELRGFGQSVELMVAAVRGLLDMKNPPRQDRAGFSGLTSALGRV